MSNDDEEFIKQFLAAIEAAKLNSDHHDLDQFSDNVIQNLDHLQSIQQSVTAASSNSFIVSALYASKSPLDTLQRITGITNSQLKLLSAIQVIKISSERLTLSFEKILSKKLAIVLCIFLSIITAIAILVVYILPVMKPHYWPLFFAVGHLIGMGIRKIIDRSFRVYVLKEKLEMFNLWITSSKRNV